MVYKGNVPSMHQTGEGGMRIYHKECIGVITSTTGFDVQTYQINPGLNGTFPWLSGIARNYQQYDINGLAFVYKPTCSDAISAATVSSMGSVSMSSDQNVIAQLPTSTIQMLQAQFSVSGKPSAELVMPVEQNKKYGGRMTTHLLVRTGDVPAGGNRQFYDDCVMFVATDGNGVEGTQLGQLFVTYDISFYNPASLAPGSEDRTCRWTVDDTIDGKSNLFGASEANRVVEFDNIGVRYDGGDNGLYFDIGNVGIYMVHYHVKTTLGATNNWFANWTVTGGTLLTKWNGGTSNYAKTPYGLEPSSGMDITMLINIPDPTVQCVITTWAVNQAVTAAESGELTITQVHPEIV